jgi:hypothetical protein
MEFVIEDHLDTVFIWIADTIARHSMVSCDYSCSGHFCTYNGYKRASEWYRVLTDTSSFLSLTIKPQNREFSKSLKSYVESLGGRAKELRDDGVISIYYRFTDKERDYNFTDEECRESEERNQNFWNKTDTFLKQYLSEEDRLKKVVRKSERNVDMILNRGHVV